MTGERYLVTHLLATAAEQAPRSVAVEHGDLSVTYAELLQRSRKIAAGLQHLGVGRGDRVGVHLDKSIDAVAALYGTMLTGAAYVPLDPSAPAARLQRIAADCEIAALISSSHKAAWPDIASGPSSCAVVLFDADDGDRPDRPSVLSCDLDTLDEYRPMCTLDQDLAYILYTSGSTGTPKGVMLSHRNAMAFIEWATAQFAVGPDDVLTSLAPFHFDLSIFDLYAAAAGRARLVLVPKTTIMFPKRLVELAHRSGVTVWYSVPSVLTMILTQGVLDHGSLPRLRQILFAGEVFPTKYLRELMDLLPHASAANLYGPTETNVCTWYQVPDLDPNRTEPVPIGRAVANDELYIVGDDGRLVPDGEVGELWVRGATVMRGYWGDRTRTTERLVADPFRPELGDPVYRTGDLVRREQSGDLTFLGRRDAQIKSRGHRIELGDIEAALSAHPAVQECAVVAVPDDLVTNRLIAHVGVGDSVIDPDLSRHCAQLLPSYMVPERFICTESLPKTSTGKIDRQSLSAETTELDGAGR